MRSYKIMFTLLFLMVILPSKGQNSFRSGYIIKGNGQLHYGMISEQTGNKNPESLIFKHFEIASEITYDAESIKEFGYINGRRFVSMAHSGANEFFEVLVSGRISLFSQGKNLFISKDNSSLTQLGDKEIKYYNEGKVEEFSNLNDFMNFITEGSWNISGKDTDQKENLINNISAYDEKSGNVIVYKPGIKSSETSHTSLRTVSKRTKFGLTGGLNAFYFSATQVYKNTILPPPCLEIAPVFGIKMEKVISIASDKHSLEADLFLLNQTFYSYNIEESTSIYMEDFFYSFNSVKLNFLYNIRLRSYSEGKLKPYISAGLSSAYNYKTDYLHIRDEVYMTEYVFTTEDSDLKLAKISFAGVAGSGIKLELKNNMELDIALRIEAGQGLLVKQLNMSTFHQFAAQANMLIGITF